jgi:RNA polymerase sigma-70 factor (ECF subfamily)
MLDEVLNINLQSTAQLTGIDPAVEVTRSDEFLVRCVLEGDETAFAEIFERYKRTVTRSAGRFFRERADIEECVQKTFTKAYFSLAKFRGAEERSLAAWLTRIAVNVCYDEYRRRHKSSESLLTELSDDESDYLERVLDSNEISVEKQLIARQLAEKVLSFLDPKDRLAVMLVYSEDHSLAEVADKLGISISNLKSRLFRCRKSIKNRFQHLIR